MEISGIIMVVVAVVVIALIIVAVVWWKKSNSAQRGSSQLNAGQSSSSQSEATHASAQSESAVDAKSAAEKTQTTKVQQTAQKQATQQQTQTPQVQTPESVPSRLTRLRSKLGSSANPLGKALFAILTRDHLTEEDWEDLEDTLLLADVGAEASEQLVEGLKQDARIQDAQQADTVRAMLKERLLDVVGRDMDRSLVASRADNAESTVEDDAAVPSVIIMVGVNGTGKTTTAGKLARFFVAQGKSVVLGAADTFRAAAADQLVTWGERSGVPVVRSDKDGADPASVAFEAARKAVESKADVLIVDTAGRLQNKANLMDELGKIRRVIEKTTPVDEVLLVLDATTGQNGMIQAKVFAEAIGITGVVLTKLDGSAKGGIVVNVQRELGVPVKLVGLGEGPDDLAPFDPVSFVDGMLGLHE